MRRRTFVCGMGAAAATGLRSGAWAQQPKRVGALTLRNVDAEAFRKELREGLARAGLIDGRNVLLDIRSAQGMTDLLPRLAAELVASRVDVLVALLTPSARAAREATREIPIVAIIANAVETGFMASLARPGGNMTGVSLMAAEAHGKCVEVLRDMLPSLRNVAALGNASDPFMPLFLEKVYLSGREAGVEIATVTVSRPDQIEGAFDEIVANGVGAVVVQGSLSGRIAADAALSRRLPSASFSRSFSEAGGLMAYGANTIEAYQRAVLFVIKILGGANASELPAEQPTKFELVVNLTTATALGLTIPSAVLASAELIE